MLQRLYDILTGRMRTNQSPEGRGFARRAGAGNLCDTKPNSPTDCEKKPAPVASSLLRWSESVVRLWLSQWHGAAEGDAGFELV